MGILDSVDALDSFYTATEPGNEILSLDTSDDTWDFSWDEFFGDIADFLGFGGEKNGKERPTPPSTAESALMGILGLGGQYLMKDAQSRSQDERDRLNREHQLKLQELKNAARSGGSGRPPAGKADKTTSNLDAKMVKR